MRLFVCHEADANAGFGAFPLAGRRVRVPGTSTQRELGKVSILDKIMGRGKKAAGDLTGDASLKAQGRREERKGEAKEDLAKAQERADEKAQDVADLERRT
jgi:uncharacterized protein YjbJ (UPF0337 family)